MGVLQTSLQLQEVQKILVNSSFPLGHQQQPIQESNLAAGVFLFERNEILRFPGEKKKGKTNKG